MSVQALEAAGDAVQPGTLTGPRGLPFVGVAPFMAADPLKYFESLVKRYGRVHRLPLGREQMVMLHDAGAIEQMLRLDLHAYRKSPATKLATDPLLGTSMATVIEPERWAEIRAFILPLFTPPMLQKYFNQVVASVAREQETLAGIAAGGSSVDVYSYMHEATFRVLMKTIFSRGIAPGEVPEIVEWFNDQTAYISMRYLTGTSPLINLVPAVHKGRASLERLNERVRRLIEARRAEGPHEADDMLDVLLQGHHADGSPLSYDEVRDNIMTMLFGGHETTAGSVTWAWGLLSRNPDKREKMLNEIDTALGGRPPVMADLKNLPYTEMVLKEAMRLYPMFPFLARAANEDTQIAGYPIAKGTSVLFCAWTAHRDPRYWPDPEAFIPERHTPEEEARRPKCSYLPFSHGQRRCIGERLARMEATLLLAMLSQRFTFDLVAAELPEPKVSMSIKPKGGMRMIVRPRSLAAG